VADIRTKPVFSNRSQVKGKEGIKDLKFTLNSLSVIAILAQNFGLGLAKLTLFL
jgi:hypothetical protein